MTRNQRRPKQQNLTERNNNYEDKVNEDHNELPGVGLCIGVLGCCTGAGHVRYCGRGSRRTGLQRGHAEGPVSGELQRVHNFGGNFVPTAVLQGLQFNGDVRRSIHSAR